MTLIDQRILIPAPIQTVWLVIADHHQLPQWRSDVTTISLLSTKSDTVGTRRRITPTGSHKDIIEEITAWYAGVGYEYHLIQGSTFKNFVSRVRLQSTPDGTIVQWTIAFEVGGLLKRILTGRRRRKRLENITATSLRQLRRHIEQLGVKLDQNYRDKRSIQKAPDAQHRAEYGAKLAAQIESQTNSGVAQTSDQLARSLAAEEPPIRLDDTPSVPKVPPPSFITEALSVNVDEDEEKVSQDFAPPISQEDTKPTSPVILTDSSTPIEPVVAPQQPKTEDTPLTDPIIENVSANHKVDTKPKRPADIDGASTKKSSKKLALEDTDPSKKTIRSDLPPPTAKRDTGEISIWDAFGVNRPKDELTATIDELLKTPDEKDTSSQAVDHSDSEKMDHLSLDEWLAANEPPLPTSASGSVRTLARPPRKTVRGLRRSQKQMRHSVRRPKRPIDPKNPDQE